jgi:hypothetical protein
MTKPIETATGIDSPSSQLFLLQSDDVVRDIRLPELQAVLPRERNQFVFLFFDK